MRLTGIYVVIGVGLVLTACTRSPPSFDSARRAEVEAEIRQRLDDYATAVTSKDLEGILSFWSDSVVFAGDGAILGGFEQWAPVARHDNETVDHWIHLTWDNVHVLALAPDAGSATVEATYQKVLVTGDTVSGYGSWTYVLRRNAHGWQVYQSNGHHPVR